MDLATRFLGFMNHPINLLAQTERQLMERQRIRRKKVLPPIPGGFCLLACDR